MFQVPRGRGAPYILDRVAAFGRTTVMFWNAPISVFGKERAKTIDKESKALGHVLSRFQVGARQVLGMS